MFRNEDNAGLISPARSGYIWFRPEKQNGKGWLKLITKKA